MQIPLRFTPTAPTTPIGKLPIGAAAGPLTPDEPWSHNWVPPPHDLHNITHNTPHNLPTLAVHSQKPEIGPLCLHLHNINSRGGCQGPATIKFVPLPQDPFGLIIGRASFSVRGLQVFPIPVASDHMGEIFVLARSQWALCMSLLSSPWCNSRYCPLFPCQSLTQGSQRAKRNGDSKYFLVTKIFLFLLGHS